MTKKYTKLKYIESTGTQWIDTQKIPVKGEIHCAFKYTGTSEYAFLYSAIGIKTSNQNSNSFYVQTDDKFYFRTADGASLISNVDNDKHSIIHKFTNTDSYFDETSIVTKGSDSNECTTSIFLLCGRSAASAAYRQASAIIYSFEIIDNDVCTLNLVPARDSNGTVCMYDTVSDEFFYNQGTGDFIAGPIDAEHTLENDNIKIISDPTQKSIKVISKIPITEEIIQDSVYCDIYRMFGENKINVANSAINILITSKDIIMTPNSNPEVFKVLKNNDLVDTDKYLLRSTAELITLLPLFTSDLQITSFNEFEYFTGIIDIPTNCFKSCTNLKSILLPNTINSIGNEAFNNCTSLQSHLTIPNNTNISIGDLAFNNTKITKVSCGYTKDEIMDNSFPITEYNVTLGDKVFPTNTDILLPYLIINGHCELVKQSRIVSLHTSISDVKYCYRGLSSATFTSTTGTTSSITFYNSSFYLADYNDVIINATRGATGVNMHIETWKVLNLKVTSNRDNALNGGKYTTFFTSSIAISKSRDAASAIQITSIIGPSGLIITNSGTSPTLTLYCLQITPPPFSVPSSINITTIYIPKGSKNLYATASDWASYIDIIEEIDSTVDIPMPSEEFKRLDIQIPEYLCFEGKQVNNLDDSWKGYTDQYPALLSLDLDRKSKAEIVYNINPIEKINEMLNA